jgi:gamma-glutamylcyclotransferase (GGCT)/AIG2-like uncharacterized protein YtfP
MMPAAMRHVFVYGTLRRGDDNDITRFAPAPVYVGPAAISGRMFHLGAYPGVVLAPGAQGEATGQVVGEVYAINASLEQQLDALEEVYPQENGSQSGEYFKREIDVDVQGRLLRCIVYEINPDRIVGRRVISSGDWVLDRHKKA